MSAFIYAVPGATVSAEVLARIGLDKILAGTKPLTQPYGEGPEQSGAGFYLTNSGAVRKFTGVWTKSFNGEYFIGYDPDDPPTEKELARETQLRGHRVKLLDGGEWLIPVVRLIEGGSALPKRIILGAKGEVVEEAMSEYVEFANQVEKLWSDSLKVAGKLEGEYELTEGERVRLVYDALTWNYRVGVEEINALGLIGDQVIRYIYEAMLDGPTLQAIIKQLEQDKKKESGVNTPAGCSTAAGAKDC